MIVCTRGVVKGLFPEMHDTIGPRIKQARERAGYSQRDLAEIAGIHNTTLGKWERNEAVPAADALQRLARALGTTSEYLLGYEATLFGYPLRHDWPPGLLEFVQSKLAREMELRPWEVAVLAAMVEEGMVTKIGHFGLLLMRWRMEHFDMAGVDIETISYTPAKPK